MTNLNTPMCSYNMPSGRNEWSRRCPMKGRVFIKRVCKQWKSTHQSIYHCSRQTLLPTDQPDLYGAKIPTHVHSVIISTHIEYLITLDSPATDQPAYTCVCVGRPRFNKWPIHHIRVEGITNRASWMEKENKHRKNINNQMPSAHLIHTSVVVE